MWLKSQKKSLKAHVEEENNANIQFHKYVFETDLLNSIFFKVNPEYSIQ